MASSYCKQLGDRQAHCADCWQWEKAISKLPFTTPNSEAATRHLGKGRHFKLPSHSGFLFLDALQPWAPKERNGKQSKEAFYLPSLPLLSWLTMARRHFSIPFAPAASEQTNLSAVRFKWPVIQFGIAEFTWIRSAFIQDHLICSQIWFGWINISK